MEKHNEEENGQYKKNESEKNHTMDKPHNESHDESYDETSACIDKKASF